MRTRVTSELFREVMGHFATGVTVITAQHEGHQSGMTASAVSSLSLEPPMLLVCINRDSRTNQVIGAAGYFGVSVLDEHQDRLAKSFARSEADDKFDGVPIDETGHGVPLLAEALARFECAVAEEIPGGTHTVFFGEVIAARARAGAPLAYYRGRFGRLAMAEDDFACAHLRRDILAGQYAPGEALEPAAIARETGIGLRHVYSALARLEREDMVIRDPAGGHVVAAAEPSALGWGY